EGVSETVPMKPDVVLVPLDGSEISESVVPLASVIAAKMGAELLFVRVSNMAYSSAMGDAGIYYASPVTFDQASSEAAEYLEPFVEAAKLADISASMQTPTGSPANALMAIADENENTLIVIGTRGQSGLKRLVLGSVTDKVIRTSGHPVLVVPPNG
ncbi:universal stress protein, partial [Dehalococcoides mccartyi]|nr:universal stress protein [Dehalococcoides mccartyi]